VSSNIYSVRLTDSQNRKLTQLPETFGAHETIARPTLASNYGELTMIVD
jgi:hypothetical protein